MNKELGVINGAIRANLVESQLGRQGDLFTSPTKRAEGWSDRHP